jgi:DNA (cytosine-5)-methyltransferase 1
LYKLKPIKHKMPRFIDLFAGAGGLSEGFIQAGFTPVAHVEMLAEACNTLKTRAAFHYLDDHGRLNIYENYLYNNNGRNDRQAFWNQVPHNVTDRVIQAKIGADTINGLFNKIDQLADNKPVELIIGGPPCQAYSLAGRARMRNDVQYDQRNYLYLYYLKFLEHYQPEMFVFENVVGIRTALDGGPFDDLQQRAKLLGYEVEPRVQLASEYGVMQRRRRMIIVGWKRQHHDGTYTRYHYPVLQQEQTDAFGTRNDLFSDLPPRLNGGGNLTEVVEYIRPLNNMVFLHNTGIRGHMNFTTQHVARPTNEHDREIYVMAIQAQQHGERFMYTDVPAGMRTHHNVRSFLDRFYVIDPDHQSHTLVAHISKDGHYYIYPTEHPTVENVRSITVREAARIQSFPDDYFFEGGRTSAFLQIGNAVPVRLAYHIARGVLEELK